ncbi:MAG: glycoside hydrolase family 2 [Fuerstiella sp.]|nr:glycoside hydrolase family 2 [Fuerstiella sp.]MCP4859467.1 glycoside hydrolase family 2 [Fuerstiella sp.]
MDFRHLLQNVPRHAISLASCLVVLGFVHSVPSQAAEEVVDEWSYTLRRPAEDWRRAAFDDAGWKESPGGFGMRDTPGARIGTIWSTQNIWLRKWFTLEKVPTNPALLLHHDEDVEVYINGRRVAALKGYSTKYEVVPIDPAGRKELKTGKNLMAVHCRQTGGGQFIDVHLVDGDDVPELPPAKRITKPFQSELITRWGAEVTDENAWTEYPRPQLARDDWQNLNGNWDYAITPLQQKEMPSDWAGKILVPYCLESKLGGVSRLLDATEALWYRRTFRMSPANGLKTMLNFEAVDYRCEVFVNGTSVGSHSGGHTPFSFDVSAVIHDGDNDVVVRVEDETEGWQLRGKQVLNARGIWYTQVSGIWQTVWLERVAASHIEDLTITTDVGSETITVRPKIAATKPQRTVRVVVKDGEKPVGETTGQGELTVAISDAKLWSPAAPHLYNLEISLLDSDGTVLDRVSSYAGIRSVGKKRGKDGHLRFTLNGEEIFHWGPLDQGWWPDGLLTPPSDAAMAFDIQWLKKAGFNMIRKHIKVEPRRYYYHCDRLGMMVWQDQVSAGNNPPWTRLKPDPQDANWPDNEHDQFMLELERMIDTLENHPSIVVWVPFNEAWGQHRTVDVGKWTVERDPRRLVNVASGGNFWPVGDVVDHHSYPHPEFPFDEDRYGDFIKVMGEFGGHGYPVKDHLWDADRRNWGYGGLPQNKAEYKQRYVTSLQKLEELRTQGIAAGIYTQTTDVEGEVNGLMTYDRKVIKIPAEELAKLHATLGGTATSK